MAYSPLVDRIAPPTTKKWSSRAGAKIIGAVVHHWAGTSMGGYHRLVESRDKASVNYLILNDGTLIGSVDEKYRAWTSGSYAVDRKRVTIEVQNETGAPEWRVSAAATRTLVLLLADLAARHGWKRIAFGDQVRGHREFASTSCPGPYLWPRLPEISADAQRARLGNPPKGTSKPAPAPKPKPSKNPHNAGTNQWPYKPLKVNGSHKDSEWDRAWRKLMWDVGYRDSSLTNNVEAWMAKLGYYEGIVGDDDWGYMLNNAVQRFLRDKGLYTALIDGPRTRIFWVARGKKQITAEKKYLNLQRLTYDGAK